MLILTMRLAAVGYAPCSAAIMTYATHACSIVVQLGMRVYGATFFVNHGAFIVAISTLPKAASQVQPLGIA